MRARRARRALIALAAILTLAVAGTWIASAVIASPARSATAQRIRITILGNATDTRIPAVREAIEHWNSELARLGLETRFDSGVVAATALPETELRAASGAQAKPWSFFADRHLRAAISEVPGDLVIALSATDLISFGIPMRNGAKGVIGIRRADMPPLSRPNTVRNVAAHEIGHVLGLMHNSDSTTLMCGRPASCRPAAFASDSAHFFPLTTADEKQLRARWQ